MTKPRAEYYRFRVPIYGAWVLLVRSTPEAYLQVLKPYYDKTSAEDLPIGDGESSLLTHPTSPPMAVIWLSERAVLTDPYWIATLAHECWHAVWRLAREIGLSKTINTEPSGESHAYLHGWLVEQCVTRLQRRGRRRRAGQRKK